MKIDKKVGRTFKKLGILDLMVEIWGF